MQPAFPEVLGRISFSISEIRRYIQRLDCGNGEVKQAMTSKKCRINGTLPIDRRSLRPAGLEYYGLSGLVTNPPTVLDRLQFAKHKKSSELLKGSERRLGTV
jgi:hypothetical protein